MKTSIHPLRQLCMLTVLVLYAGGATPAGAGYVDVVTADNPVAYWRLGETSGTTTAADASGNNHTATYTGSPTLGVTGAIVSDPVNNRAVTLNGSSQYAQVADVGTAFAPGSGSWTMECWVKTTSSQQGSFVTWYEGGIDGGGPGIYNIYMQADGTVKSQLRGDPDNVVAAVTSMTVNDGAWHQVVAVLDRPNSSLNLYVDGTSAATPVSTVSLGDINRTISGVPLNLGANYNYSNGYYDYFAGALDEVALYGSALSATDVAEHYAAATAAIPEPGMLALLAVGGLVVFKRRRA